MGIYRNKAIRYLQKDGCSVTVTNMINDFLEGRATLVVDSPKSSLATYQPVVCDAPDVPQQEEKETTMTLTLDVQQAEYFRERARGIKCDKLTALKRQFGLEDDETPRTAEEIIERITTGKYVLTPAETPVFSGSRFARFQWRDPAVKQDVAGYDAAVKSFQTAYDTAKDTIMSAPADGAKAVATLQAWTA